MHPSSISLTYTGIPLFKTFMNIKLIVYTLQKKKKKSKRMRQEWLRGKAQHLNKKETTNQ